MTRNADEGSAQLRMDRRVRRTRHALQHALMELVLEKGYERVTVQDVIDRADVGRSTFYAHFHDKEDLFLSGIEAEVREAFGARADARDAPSLWLFRHAGEHADLYRVLVRRRAGWQLVSRRIEDTLVEVYEERLRDAATSSSVPVEAAARFLGSALTGLVSWWLAAGMPLDPDVIDHAFRGLATNGTRTALGVEI